MLSKQVDWAMLSPCDLYAVKRKVENCYRSAEFIVRPLSERRFDHLVATTKLWSETYETVCSSYANLVPNFKIDLDKHNGYRLLYVGSDDLKPSAVIKGPVGFVRPIRNGVTDWSVMCSERTGETLLLVGPVRFVNSDCNPNCEYDYSSVSGVVQLRTKKRISSNSEILVKYGPDFFEQNSCKCQTCEELEEKVLMVLAGFLSEFVRDFVQESVAEENKLLSIAPVKPKKKRLSQRELVEMYNRITEVPPSDLSRDSSAAVSQSRYVITHRSSPLEVLESSGNLEPHVDDSPDESLSADLEVVSEVGSIVNKFPRASSPLCYRSFDCSLSTIQEKPESPQPIDATESAGGTPLFPISTVTVQQATALLDLFSSRFSLSDEASIALYSVTQALLPTDNCLPSGHSLVRQMKRDLSNQTRASLNSLNGNVIILNFRNQLKKIVQRNLRQIFYYSQFRRENVKQDLNPSIAPTACIQKSKLELNLLMSTDDVNIKKSTYKKEMWPVWLQCSDMPPILRMSRKNIVLSCLFVGSGAPNWNEIVPRLRAELFSPIEISTPDFPKITTSFKVRLLVTDLVAKPHVLNMVQFNGYFGCHFCTAEGITIGRAHAYYPYNQSGSIRETTLPSRYVEAAELRSATSSASCFGVKGQSAFSDIVSGLPLTAPIDYMHCILLGVFPELLKHLLKKMAPTYRREINDLVPSLTCSRELITYSRKI